MAENSDEKAKEPSISDLKQNIDDEYSTAGKTLEKETNDAAVLKTQDDFRLVGRNYIENIKASLLASSANFNRAKYAATLEDPYMKAYRYLEEHKVLALFEDLIAHTAFQRPSEPFPFMAKLVEDFYTDSEQKGTKSEND
ncbi:Hypothetical predicted protein [Paramuricea clavata]|uniref:Uncharacterized protein n=1 Tax=Paramuricea clavata TaxID=317549 RepID=A0A7D9DE14_PARCT|nr:Hypothetical predicted protein [Paramuricea clavata]